VSHTFTTPDELAGALFAQQGYLVLAGLSPIPIGQIVPVKNGATLDTASVMDTRVRIVAPSSYEEWRAQCLLSHSLLGYVEQIDRYPYYHRVEACE